MKDIPELHDHDHAHEDGVVAIEHLKPGERVYVQGRDGTILVRVHEHDIQEIRKWERQRGALLGLLLGFAITVLGFILGRLL